MEQLKNEIDKIFNEIEEKIKLTDIKIRAEANEAHFTSNYIIALRDDYNHNEGCRSTLNIIRNRIHGLINKENNNGN